MSARPTSAGALFVAFEGGDGAGKSTLTQLLAEELRRAGRQVVVTRQPGGTPLGAALRELLLHGEALCARAEALLFAADKAQHVEEVVRPALDAGVDVVTDRYVDSSVAYQGAGRGLGSAQVSTVLDWAVGGLTPHLTVVLDLPVDVARRRRRAAPDRVESEPDGFHERVRQQFLDRVGSDPSRYLVADATRAPAEVVAQVLDALVTRSLLPGHRAGEVGP